jgi:hypothetical protein
MSYLALLQLAGEHRVWFSAETALIKAGAEVMSELHDRIGLWTATTTTRSRDRIMKATLCYVSPELAEAFRRTPGSVGT